ncbi:MAG: hypothetical protein WA665_11530, partial [Pseudolabrys sp.]
LEELHADFFPRRIEVFKEGTHAILQPATKQPLSRNDLISMYNKYGDYLHRGRLKTAEGLERIAKLEKTARKGPQPSEYAC